MKKKTYVLTISKVFPTYHPKKGIETYFLTKLLELIKKHTIRGNYDLWKYRIDEINAGRAILSVRQWSGKPYQSKQVEVAQFSNLGYQAFEFKYNYDCMTPYIGNWPVDVDTFIDVCENDGLSKIDFLAWFKYPKPFKGIMIHFTDLRY